MLRIVNIGIPYLSAEEARVGARAGYLASYGSDEIGRKFPLVFNSSEDYQLPVTSYLAAAGVKLFSKTDLGLRLPFVLVGTLLIFLTYLAAGAFNLSQKLRLIASLLVACSPVLIFLSKVPNELIILVTLFTSLFYLLTKERVNLIGVLMISLLAILTSKITWFTIFPFCALTLLFFKKDFSTKNKLLLFFILMISVAAFLFFMKIPQAKRSLVENNFPIFSNITVENGINRLRGQGSESGWPPILDKLLFNKAHFIFVGLLNWISVLSPATFFGQFDERRLYGFMGLGAWAKVLIIPFILSLVSLIRKPERKFLLISGFLLVLTYPVFFIFPRTGEEFTILCLPLMAILISYGFIKMNKKFSVAIILITLFEVLINLFSTYSQIRNSNDIRPGWIRKPIMEAYTDSMTYQIAFSDNITEGMDALIQWYAPSFPVVAKPKTDFAYKFSDYKFSNFRLIGNNDEFRNCGFDRPIIIFASLRDLNKIQNISKINVDKIYEDIVGNKTAYKLSKGICIK